MTKAEIAQLFYQKKLGSFDENWWNSSNIYTRWVDSFPNIGGENLLTAPPVPPALSHSIFKVHDGSRVTPFWQFLTTLGHLVSESFVTLTKGLMFQVLLFFLTFLQNSLHKSFSFYYNFTKTKSSLCLKSIRNWEKIMLWTSDPWLMSSLSQQPTHWPCIQGSIFLY